MGIDSLRSFELKSQILADTCHTSDQTNRRVWVYLPPNHTPNGKLALAVFLAGWPGKGSAILSDPGPFGAPALHDELDKMILKGELPPLVAVFPDGTTTYGCSQYVNSTVTGHHMDHLCDEILPEVYDRYGVDPDPNQHAVLGHSSGGYGSLMLGMLRPDHFRRICSSAGDSGYELLYLPLIGKAISCIEKHGGLEGFLEAFMSSPNPTRLLGSDAFNTMMLLNICMCFTPNRQAKPIPADLFFDLHTGDIDPAIWDRFCQWDPVVRVRSCLPAMKQHHRILLESGVADEYALQLGHRKVAKILKENDIAHQVNEYPGKHGGHNHRYPSRLKHLFGQ